MPSLEIDEFNTIGQSINKMLEKFDDTIGHLSVHREELRLIVSTIDAALWSQNKDGLIEWANDAFFDIFAVYDRHKEHNYWDVIREPEVIEVIEKGHVTREKGVIEVCINDQYYVLSGSENKRAERKVFVLQNIDEIRKTQQMKKDFMVNLSHELRTPLTAIKGFSEAMEETAKPENIRYLKIIQSHTNRLIALIDDLQSLTRLENCESLHIQEIRQSTFFENIANMLNPLIEEKGLSLKLDIDPKQDIVYVDPFKFEQVFINLIQNSLRYTDKGEIGIKSKIIEGIYYVEVCDEGSGIPAIHLPRIFERFYVADPARNRANSGTGLGLAIVKHIVLLHNGKIEVNSIENKGTCFHISIPQKRPEDKT